METTAAIGRETFRVRAGEVGAGGWLRPPALCDWLQEAAGNHAISLGFGTEDLLRNGLTWVLSRLHLQVRRMPRWGEAAVVETWPSGVLRLRALREFRVTGEGGGLLAAATSGWLVLKVEGKRPVRPPPEVGVIAEKAPPRLLSDPFEDLPAPGAGAAPGPFFRVGRYDLDLNGHANNVAVVRWLLEALPDAPDPARPLSIEAEFRGESFEGDRLQSRVEAVGDGRFRVVVARERDGREVARAAVVSGR